MLPLEVFWNYYDFKRISINYVLIYEINTKMSTKKCQNNYQKCLEFYRSCVLAFKDHARDLKMFDDKQ